MDSLADRYAFGLTPGATFKKNQGGSNREEISAKLGNGSLEIGVPFRVNCYWFRPMKRVIRLGHSLTHSHWLAELKGKKRKEG